MKMTQHEPGASLESFVVDLFVLAHLATIVSMETDPSASGLLDVPSADVLRLIQAHLRESGLHESCRVLQEESGVGLAGSLHPASFWEREASTGNWPAVLKALSTIDKERCRLDPGLVAQVHEMTILELAEAGEWSLAYGVFRLAQPDLVAEISASQKKRKKGDTVTIARLLEQKLAALADQRQKDPKCPVPDDFYSSSGSNPYTKQQRRDEIGQLLADSIPHQPTNRLTDMIQQAVQWQTYTGQMPRIKRWWEEEDAWTEEGELAETTKTKKKRKVKEFDLVLGEVEVDSVAVTGDALGAVRRKISDPVVKDVYSTVTFGKKATCECAAFLPDASSLVTGSSDGLIEIWEGRNNAKFDQLRTTDLPYQQSEELMGHDEGAVTALAVSNDCELLASGGADGQVRVWRIETGKCLRVLAAHSKSAVNCLAFAPDSSRLLTAGQDGTCREFGLRTSRMLKEFRGHTSYLTACFYHIVQSEDEEKLLVVTASGDGTVRLWNGTTSDVIHVLRPISVGKSLSLADSSLAVADQHADRSTESGSPTVHSILPLHTPTDMFILVPRGQRAFLVDYQGKVMRTFDSGTESVFVAAAVNATNRWLYTVKDDGTLCVFGVETGEQEKSITDFGSASTYKTKSKDEKKHAAEVSALVSHPNTNILGAYSNDKAQKKGLLVLWK
jgi:WD40 repeat-containing protein SMU1